MSKYRNILDNTKVALNDPAVRDQLLREMFKYQEWSSLFGGYDYIFSERVRPVVTTPSHIEYPIDEKQTLIVPRTGRRWHD